METSSRLNESLLFSSSEEARTGDGPINISSLDLGMLSTHPGASTTHIPGNYVHAASSSTTPLSSYTPASTLFDPTTLFPDTLNGTILRPQQPTTAVSDEPKSIMARLASRNVPGIILPGATYYRRLGQSFPQRRYAVLLDEPIAETDCGAEIIDASTGHTNGYIVQVEHYSRVQVAYAMAVTDTAWDINKRFDEETRHATLWYDRQRRIFPTPLFPQNQGMPSAISPAISPAPYTPQPAATLTSQAGLVFGDSHASPFPLATTPAISLSAPPILGSNRGRHDNCNKPLIQALCRNLEPPKKDLQVQFVHYRGASDNVKKEKSASRHSGDDDNTDDCDDTWKDSDRQDLGHGLGFGGSGSNYGDTTDDDIPIGKLLPDRKCPFRKCPYHSKGFVRKHDLVRHIITHYDGNLYCGFCPEELSRTFGRPFLRVEPLKRHLAVIHNAAKYRKSHNTTEAYLRQRLSEYSNLGGGHCSICSRHFSAATKLYNHVEGCVVRLLLERAKTDDGLPSIPDDGGGGGMDT